MMNSNDDFKIVREDILLIENKLKHINSNLGKLNSSIYSDLGRLSILNYKNHKLSEDLAELKQDAKEEYAEAWLIHDELKNIKEEIETLEVAVKNMIDKYYS